MYYNELSKGYEILYKYTDGTAIKFRTTPVLKNQKELNIKLKELDKFEGMINVLVREVMYHEYETPEVLKSKEDA